MVTLKEGSSGRGEVWKVVVKCLVLEKTFKTEIQSWEGGICKE